MDQDKPTSTSKKLRQSAEQTGDDISSNSDTTDSESEELQNARPGRKKNWVYFRPPVTKKNFVEPNITSKNMVIVWVP